EVNGAELRRYVVDPAKDLGLAPAPAEALAGGTPEHNAEITRAVLEGRPGPQLDLALANAGAAIYAAGATASIAEGIDTARAAIESGSAALALERYVRLTA